MFLGTATPSAARAAIVPWPKLSLANASSMEKESHSRITTILCQTINSRREWEEPGETIIQITLKRHIVEVMKRKGSIKICSCAIALDLVVSEFLKFGGTNQLSTNQIRAEEMTIPIEWSCSVTLFWRAITNRVTRNPAHNWHANDYRKSTVA